MGHSTQKIFSKFGHSSEFKVFSLENIENLVLNFAPWKCSLKIFFSLWSKAPPSPISMESLQKGINPRGPRKFEICPPPSNLRRFDPPLSRFPTKLGLKAHSDGDGGELLAWTSGASCHDPPGLQPLGAPYHWSKNHYTHNFYCLGN